MNTRIFCFFLIFTTFFKISISSQNKPNILCIVCEDIGPYLSCFGDSTVSTPSLDKLASEGIRYNRMYTTVGVCAPSRAALITGMYPSSIGANYMRNYSPLPNYKALPADITQYEVVLPEGVKCYTEYMRAAGYFCTNNSKTDYQFASPITAWDEDGNDAHWKHRLAGQPFFSIFNLMVTHESQIWGRTKLPLTVNLAKVPIPPYFPDDPIIRHDVAVMYSNIHEMDKQVKELIDQVKAAGLLGNTIIIFYSDNGGPLPRQKRALYESGTLVPFMIRFPDGYKKGEVNSQLCSFVDIPATILSLAGLKPPKYMHGKAFLGDFKTNERQYVFGARNRMDEQIDKQGYVRDSLYRYIRNYMPERSNYMAVEYRLQMPMMKRMIELLERDSLNEIQKLWFKSPRLAEEFYDVEKDPHEINNLIDNPTYLNEIERLRKAYQDWDIKYNLHWKLSENESREIFWPKGIQPKVEKPEIKVSGKRLILVSETKGSSIAYQVNSQKHWLLYTEPITIKKGDSLKIIAVRAGYKNSEVVDYKTVN